MEPEVKVTKRKGLLGLQVGLRQLLLATLCAGVWIAHWTNQDGIARLESRLANLQTLSPELIVAEPKKIAVVQMPTPWRSISSWEVYVPTDMVRICLATEDIVPGEIPGKYESALLPKGQYEVQLEERRENGDYRFLVTQNGQACLNLELPRDPASNVILTDSDVSYQTKQSDGEVPIVLFRKRFFVTVPGTPVSSTSPTGPANGCMVWIENDR